MYFHVLIEKKEKHPNSSIHVAIYELDIANEDQIIQDIFIPYFNGVAFEFDGRFISTSDIERIKVFRSSKLTSEYADEQNSVSVVYWHKHEMLHDDEYVTDITKDIIKKARQTDESVHPNTKESTKDKLLGAIDNKIVFIVHGHDDLATSEVARFIEKLGFKPIILREQAIAGKTIIEQIEAQSNVGFGIVLYTPCDVGALKADRANLQPRARQNVVFEHGYLMGKIGRPRVCALVKSKVELPTDMSGVLYITMDAHEGWHKKVCKELTANGYAVDMNKLNE